MTDTPDFSSILKQAIAKIAESEDRAGALRRLMEVIVQLLGAERGFIVWKNPQTGELEVQAAHGIDPAKILSADSTINPAIIKEVLERAEPLLTTNALADARFQEQASITGFALRSVVAVPLKVDDETMGVIYCDNRLLSGLFQQAELDLIENLVDQVAEAVENLPAAALAEPEPTGGAAPLADEIEEVSRTEAETAAASSDDLIIDSDSLDKEKKQNESAKERRSEPLPPPKPQPITPPMSVPGAAIPADQTVTRGYAEEKPQDQSVKFAVYHPREVVPNEWKPLVAYVYRAFTEAQISEDAGKQLGPLMTAMRRLTQSAKNLIQEGVTITATPMLSGFQFNPPSVSIAFYEDWQRFDFKLRAKEAPLYQAANGWITFSVEGVIVGDVPLSVYVSDKAQVDLPTMSNSNKLYEAIFCSYSRQDTRIIERVERAYKALGLEYLRDVESLRSGQHWSAELRALIDKADIFQLFWSPSAAESNYVRMEWEYALKRDRDKINFIRPVYWVKPIPSVPSELSHIHFAYEPGLDS